MANLSNIIPPVSLSNATGTLPVINGGTGSSSLTANAVLVGNGTSALQAVAPGTSGNMLTSNGTAWVSSAPAPSSPTFQAIATGSLSDGTKVVINSDGTVSAVQSTGGFPFVNPKVVFRSASTTTYVTGSVYDPVNQKVIITYQDGGNSSRGYAVVGTVSGASISFGTAAMFSNSAILSGAAIVYNSAAQKVVICYLTFNNPGNTLLGVVGTVSGTSISFGTPTFLLTQTQGLGNLSATYDANTQKVVCVYTDYNAVVNRGSAVVGTVSGTSISFGAINMFKTTSTNLTFVTYDPSIQKVVLAYADGANSFYGNAAIGTVSGTSISFGTPVVFNSASTQSIFSLYEPNQQKVVIAYANVGNSSYGTAIVGTSSSTSISFGAATVFNSANTSSISMAYDANLQKIAIVFRNDPTGYGQAVVGTVSGTGVSFGGAVTFSASSTYFPAISYAANAQKAVIAWPDASNSSYGTSVVFELSGPNLSASNYIGISNGAYTNGQTATIQVAGAVDDAQSGLTPGLTYYVRSDGTLSTTAGSPSVVAGTAVGTTKIIVKG